MVDLDKIEIGKTIVYKDGVAYKIVSYYSTGHYKIQDENLLYREMIVNAKKLAERFYLSRDDALEATINRLNDEVCYHKTVVHKLIKKISYFNQLREYPNEV